VNKYVETEEEKARNNIDEPFHNFKQIRKAEAISVTWPISIYEPQKSSTDPLKL